MTRRRAILLALIVLLATLAGGVALHWQEPLADRYWAYVGGRPLTVEETDDIARCAALRWSTVVRIVAQDPEVPCAAGWLAAEIDRTANGRDRRWLERFATDARRPVRSRLRAGLALVHHGSPAPSGLSLLLADPLVGGTEREALIDAWAADQDVPDWVQPDLVAQVDARRYANGDLHFGTAVADALRLEAELSLDPAEARARRVEAALTPIGFGGRRLTDLLERIGRGLPLYDVAPGLTRTLRSRGTVCAGRSSASCLRLSADLVDAALADDPDGAPPIDAPEPHRGPESALWEVAYSDQGAVDAASRAFDAAGMWIATASGRERTGRLLGLVAHPRNRLTEDRLRDVPLGDPMLALRLRRASPWATAAAAQALGARAGIAVTVESVGDGVVLDLDGRRVGIGPCGVPIAPPTAVGPPWSRRDVLAQATIERAGSALRNDDDTTAMRLAVLAEALDPIGAAGVVDVVTRLHPAAYAGTGLRAGALVRPLDPGDVEALDDRRRRAETWPHALAEWNEAGKPTCPSPLGP